MQMVANKNLEAIKFDITIEATIEDASQAEQGKYLVSSGASKFYAYSTDSNYRERDTVMVTVPEGNYDNQKIILCKKVEKNETAVPYQSPFGHMIDVTTNLIYNYWDGDINRKNIEKGIYANYDDIYSGCPWNTDEPSFLDSAIYDQYIEFETNKSNPEYHGLNPCLWDSGELSTPFSQYTRLGLKGQFSTWLDTYQTTSGNYGLCLMVKFQSQETEDNSNSFYNFFTLDSSSFYGDPYGFETYYTQEAIFDISEYQNYLIKRLVLFVYQRNNFKNLNGEMIEAPSDGDFSTIVPNIYIKDPYVSLGYETDNFIGDSCLIYTNDSLKYKKYPETNDGYDNRNNANKKLVSLRWIHKDEMTGHISSLTKLPENYDIKWYHRKIGQPSPDDFAGANYEDLNFENTSDTGGYGVKVLDSDFDIEYYPDVNMQEDIIKAIVIKNKETSGNEIISKSVAHSNLLTLQNEDVIITSQDVIQTEALGIKCEDLQRGHYSIYKRNGKLLRDMDAKEIRYLTAVFDYSASNINLYSKALLSEATSVKWYYPAKNTMIKPYQNIGVDTGDGIYYCYSPSSHSTNYYDISENSVHPNTNCYQFAYIIHPTLYQSYSNNTIRLEVEKDGIVYTASITLTFNVAGSSGSAYTLDILWDNNDNVLDIDETNDKISGQIVLYDQDGKLVDIPDEAEVIPSWYVAVGGEDSVEDQGEILYPAFNGADSRFGWDEDEPALNADYYIYNLLEDQFVLAENVVNDDFSNNRERTLYRVKIEGESNKNKLKFTKMNKDEDESDEAFYARKKEGYIKRGSIYIVNPYRTNDTITNLQNIDAYSPQERQDVIESTLRFDFIDLTDDEGNLLFRKSKDRIEIRFKTEQNKNKTLNAINILKITLTDFGDYDLEALFPISLKKGQNYQGIDGATIVQYDTVGECDYIRNPYKLFALSNNQLQEVTVNEWRLYYQLSGSNTQNLLKFMPILSEKNVLQPYPVYVEDVPAYAIQARVGGNIVWSQPVLVYQDHYPSTTLNQWDGKTIQTDTADGVIVANGLAAGRKENDNSFSGVMLGDWSRTDTVKGLTKNTGVYGLHKGAVSYAFMDDGNAFIGSDGQGRISFDGNKGLISGSGLSINLATGNISGSNFDLTGGSTLELHSSGNPAYFKIKNGNSTLINIADNSYYLQSANYSSKNAGTSFNLSSGYLETMNVYLSGTITASNIYGGSINGSSININNKFRVDSDGNMTATNADVSGTINASAGTLGSLTVTGKLTFSGGTISGATIEGGSIRVPIGANTNSSSYFIVDSSGNVSMSGGITADKVEANEGHIGGWTISANSLTSNNTQLNSGNGHIYTDYFEVNGLGKMGYITGNDGETNTNLLGIFTNGGENDVNGIALEAHGGGNIRLTGNNIFIDISGFESGYNGDKSLAGYIQWVMSQ